MSTSSAALNDDASLPSASPAGWEGEGQLRATSAAHRATIRVLARTYSQPLQTAAAMDCLAGEFRGAAGRRMQQFAWFLNAGVPIGEAIQRTPNLLHQAHGVALRMAEQAGNFQDVCSALLQPDPGVASQSDLDRSQSTSQQLRVLAGFLVAWFVLTFFAIFIVPTFEAMFDEFELELPATFKLFVALMRVVTVVFPVLVTLLIIYFAFRAPLILESLTNRWNPNLGGRREMPPPLAVRALLANATEAEVIAGSGQLDATDHSMGSGPSLSAGIDKLSSVHSTPAIRKKLQAASQRTQQGQDGWSAVAEQGLLSRQESNILLTAQTPQTQAWLLRWFIARKIHRRRARSGFAWRLTSFLSLAVLSAIVALAAISVYSVLIGLISGLS
ncbi:type II secretion system F family protein [Roseimaritima ulvae]|uniref:Type IV pilin biogenesis protein n=1 Tax=Roseimaritima ulvae TaxID=980254 RepID=A0A5B9R0I1_9BACT|nr:type II secretion system F family protein [Roseimaritima ulvae]QEG39771.1 type IV pilin biogenesis protein [Roseimaritima ulvae]